MKTTPQTRVFYAQAGPQSWLVSCPVPEVFFGGARGGGKTFGGCLDWIAHERRYGRDAAGIWFRRTYSELEGVLLTMRRIFPAMGAYFHVSTKTWVFPSGATLRLRYLDRDEHADHYQGHEYTWQMFDEAGNWPSPVPIDRLDACLRSAAGVPTRKLLTGNPGGRGHDWIVKRYVRTPDGQDRTPLLPFLGPDGDQRVFIPSRVVDNRILTDADPSYVKRIVQAGRTQPWLVAAWLHGDWNAKPDGGYLKLGWFRRFQLGTILASDGTIRPEVMDRVCRLIVSWDTATKDKDANDFTVATVWVEIGRDLFLVDVWRGKPTHLGRVKAVRDLADRWRPHAVVIEDKGSGESLIQHLEEDRDQPFRHTIVRAMPHQSKLERLLNEAVAIEGGRVWLPEAAPWLADFELEASLFPNVDNDDQVDSLSQALHFFRGDDEGRLVALNTL